MEKNLNEETECEEITTEAEPKPEETSESKETSSNETLEAKVRELNDKYLRLYAEYDNYQKRSQREKAAIYADAVADTVAQILPVADNIERALKIEVSSDDAKQLMEGIEKIAKQISDSFAKLDIKPIKAEGEQFDPNFHNAVMHIEDETVDDNTVVEELMKGYIYKDSKVVRHSMVKVAN